jgi:hypothetical protein
VKLLKGKRLAPVMCLGNRRLGNWPALFARCRSTSVSMDTEGPRKVAACSVIALVYVSMLTEVCSAGLWLVGLVK